MRRMIPQKLIDYIKSLKGQISVNGQIVGLKNLYVAEDANVSGDLSVNGKINIKPSLAIDINLTTLAGEVEIIFSKAMVYEFGMFITGNAIISNPSDAQISVSAITAEFEVPSQYGDKIFDYGGKKVSEEPGAASTRDILTTPAFTGINNIVGGQMKNCYIRHSAKDKMLIEISYGTNIAAGGRNAVTFRTFILF